MVAPIPSLSLGMTRQYSGRSGDATQSGAQFQAFNSGVLDWRAAVALGAALVVAALVVRKGRR